MAHPTQSRVGRRIEWLAVAGAVAQGLLYCAIGFTALRAAIYIGNTPENMAGALKEMAAGPIGRTTVGLVAVAFMCVASARLLEACLGQVRQQGHAKVAVVRVWNVAVAVVYAGLSFLALRFFFQPSTSANERTSEWAALLITHPLGRWLVGAIGVITALGGLQQLITADPADDCPKWMRYCGLYGRVSFAVLLILIGGSAIMAAVFRSPGEARGIGSALTFLQHQLFGPVLLAGTGVGLLMYGLMSAVEALRKPSTQANVTV